MPGDTNEPIRNIIQNQFMKDLGLKARKWVSVTAGEAITQAALAGIIVHTTGTLIIIDGEDTEINCGTVTGDPLKIYPICPASIKNTSTAVVYAVYEV